MKDYNISIAKKTLNLLKKKSWDEIQLEEILKKSKNNEKKFKTKKDLLKNVNRYVDYFLKGKLELLI